MRRKHIRHSNWDYTWDGHYFITVCTKNRSEFLGRLDGDKMTLCPPGICLQEGIEQIETFFPEATVVSSVIMPDHFHILLSICQKRRKRKRPVHIGVIIRGLKAGVTSNLKKEGIHIKWQRGYYDRICRTQQSIDRTIQYIENNPRNATKNRRGW